MTTDLLERPLTGEPLSETATAAILETFHRVGVAKVPGVFSPEECGPLRDLTDRLAADPEILRNGHVTPVYDTMVLRHIQCLHPVFANLTVREPILGLARQIVGWNPKLCGMNVIRSHTEQAISRWHVDDLLENPLAPGQTRHDPSMRMPVLWFTVQIALTDIETHAQGPTEIVPGSHYSGRDVDVNHLEFEGQGPTPIYCRAGDAYLFNHQTWHRGAPNTSPDTRYLMQIQYCRQWVFNRFANPLNTKPPVGFDSENADLRNVLGL